MSDKDVEGTAVELTPEQQAQEANAAVAAGYKKARGEEPPAKVETPVAETKEVVKTEEKKEEAKVETTPDPIEALRQDLQGIKGKLASLDTLTNEVKAGTGRIAAIQRELATAKAAAKTVEVAPTQAQIDAAAKDPEKWEALKKDFEEWTQATEEYVKQKLAAERAELLKQIPVVDVDGIKATINQSSSEAIRRAREFGRVDSKYPTWEDDVHTPDGGLTPEFAAWMKTQTPEIQALADSDRASDALKMLDAFYEHRKAEAKKQANQARLASAVTPQQASSGGPSILPDEAGLAVGYNRMAKRA